MLPPSGLASGHELKDACIRAIRAVDSELNNHSSQLRNYHRYWKVTPELVFQSLFEILAWKLYRYFEHLLLADPNHGHSVLGRLAGIYKLPILTTNFDPLIERAAPAGTAVKHLHGNLADVRQMVVRLNQVGLGLAPGERKAMTSATANKTLYVLGYSGADTDILDALKGADLRRIVWFARKPVSKELHTNIGYVATRHKCHIAVTDLRKLFVDLGEIFQVSPGGGTPRDRDRRLKIEEWATTITKAEAWACIGDVYSLIENHELAAEIYLKGTRHANERFPKAWFLNEAADCMRLAGRFSDAHKCARRALQVNHTPTDWIIIAGTLNLLGLVELDKECPDPKRAIPYFTKAARALRNYHPTPISLVTQDGAIGFLSRIHNNLGLSLLRQKRYREAIRCFKTSLSIKRQRGDLTGMCITSMNACIASYRLKDFARAAAWKKKALAIGKRYDRRFDQAYLHYTLGVASCQQGRRKRGLSMLEDAKALCGNNTAFKFRLRLVNEAILQYTDCPDRSRTR